MTQEKKNFGAALLEVLVAPLAALPLGFHLWWGRVFAWFMHSVMKYRRDDVMINLSRSFPDKKYRELKRICKEFYLHLGDIIVESLWFGGCRNKRGRGRLNRSGIVDIVNPEVFNRVYDASTNVMVLSSHCGNWELLGGWFSYNHNPDVALHSDFSEIGVVYKELRSKTWDRFMADNRCASIKDTGFDGYVESQGIFRFAITHRKQKFIYIFPTDQFPYAAATRHPIGEFMHQDTLAMTGGTALACKFGMSVNYLRWKSVGRGRYTVEFVPISPDASKETPEGLMRKYYDLLQKDIEDQPWNYLWSHRRWK